MSDTKFEEFLQTVYNKYKLNLIEISKKLQEVNKIAEFIVNRMMEKEKDLREYVTEILTPRRQLTEIDVNADKDDSCVVYNLRIKLKLPFQLNVIADVLRPGYVRLQTQQHEMIEKSYVNRICLKNWFNKILEKTISECTVFTLGGNKYTFLCTKAEEDDEDVNKINVVDLQSFKNKVSITFEPILEFTTIARNEGYPKDLNNWLAIPLKHIKEELDCAYIFAVYGNTIMQRKNEKTLAQAVELICALWDSYKLPDLLGFMLMNFLQLELEQQDETFATQSTSEILLHFLNCLLECFKRGHVPFYFDPLKILNYLEAFNTEDVAKYKIILEKFLEKFISLKNSGTATEDEVMELFQL